MKGLLIKDFYIIKNQIYFLMIVVVCAIVFMANGNAQFGISYICGNPFVNWSGAFCGYLGSGSFDWCGSDIV